MGVKVREWKGAWWIFKTYNKQRQAVRVGAGPRAKKVAEQAAREIAAKAALNDPTVFSRGPACLDAPTVPTFRAVAEEWLTKYPALHAVSATTMENYRSFTAHHLMPFSGDTPVDRITVDLVEAFIEAKRAPGGSVRFAGKPLADASLRVGLHALRLILHRAVRRRLIAANPAREAEWSSTANRPDNVDPFTGVELRALVRAADQLAAAPRSPLRVDFPALLRVWLQTGMRAGEIAGLQWQDIDLAAGTVLVRRTWSRQRLGPTKTRQTRTVSLLHPIAEATAEWRPGSTPGSEEVLRALKRFPRP